MIPGSDHTDYSRDEPLIQIEGELAPVQAARFFQPIQARLWLAAGFEFVMGYRAFGRRSCVMNAGLMVKR